VCRSDEGVGPSGPRAPGNSENLMHVWTAPLKQERLNEKDGRIGSSHVSGLLARRVGRWPRRVSRSGSKQLCLILLSHPWGQSKAPPDGTPLICVYLCASGVRPYPGTRALDTLF
jgi:hypothetical protein